MSPSPEVRRPIPRGRSAEEHHWIPAHPPIGEANPPSSADRVPRETFLDLAEERVPDTATRQPQGRRAAPSLTLLQPGSAAEESWLSGLKEKLRHRKVGQWMLAYLGGGWMLLQVMDVLAEIWGWALLPQRLVSLVLGFGLLPAFVAAWYHGERGKQAVTPTEVGLLLATAISVFVAAWSVCLSAS